MDVSEVNSCAYCGNHFSFSKRNPVSSYGESKRFFILIMIIRNSKRPGLICTWWFISCFKYQVPRRVHTLIFSWAIWTPQGFLRHSTKCKRFTHYKLECYIWSFWEDECEAGILSLHGISTGLFEIFLVSCVILWFSVVQYSIAWCIIISVFFSR